ncbi:hypothetical protein [Salinicola rhizosphaerae]|uniref:Uncharacterized protein n=1 Tax=Salinicola rhizosphaerae TaxID=1443141 RepID=A0ABQ3E958_9GAMM|nr:hypothetical protein [Salinicola rhizosphaerae]GHB27374.1 hypothetical protein GCM10009038_27550 [Salinicola rhizosphaerae]
MSSASEMQKNRIIVELRAFIKKLLQEPGILENSLAIAKRHSDGSNDPKAWAAIANEISATTSVHIPEDPAEHSDADKLFLAVLREVVGEEKALY